MNIQNYNQQISSNRIKRLEDTLNLFESLYPDVMTSMDFKFSTYTYGQDLVVLANHKQYLSLNTCSVEHIKDFKEKHPSSKLGKVCLNFRGKDNLPLNNLIPVTRLTLENDPNHQKKE